MTAHNKSHEKAVSKTDSCSAIEEFRGVASSGVVAYLEPEIFQSGTFARQETAAKLLKNNPVKALCSNQT